MKSKWKRRLLIAFIGITACFAIILLVDFMAPTVSPDLEEKLVRADRQQIEKLIGEETEKLGITALSLAVTDGDAAATSYHFGRASDDGMMQVASLSKFVAAAVIMTVAEERGFGLDEDIRPHVTSLDVSSLSGADKPISLRRLLSHSAGASQSSYAGFARTSDIPTTQAVLIDPPRLFEFPLEFDRTEGEFHYSGGGYTLAQLWAEDVLGLPFAEIARSRLIEPLGMENSSFVQPVSRAAHADRKLIGADAGFNPTEGIFRTVDDGWHIYPELAAAGLWSTPRDYARFVSAVMRAADGEENAVSAAVAREMVTPQVATGYEPGLHYGLGTMVSIDEAGALTEISHGGANAGYRSYFAARPASADTPQRVVVSMGNTAKAARLNRAIVSGLIER